MNNRFMRLVARFSLYRWVGLCVTATVFVLVLLDWSVERTAWVQFSAAGMPAWAIVSSIALTWIRNGTFWSWVLIAGFGSAWLWHQAKKNQKDYAHAGLKLNREVETTKTTGLKNLWRVFLVILPAAGAFNGANQYGYVDGVWQKLPFSIQSVLAGFVVGIVFSGILYAIGLGLTRLLKIIRSRTSGKSLRK